MASSLPPKVTGQIRKAGLPQAGPHPFEPQLVPNRQGELVIAKKKVTKGPKRGKAGFVDRAGRIWIRDRAHASVPDHWDVQIGGGQEYIRVDGDGNALP